MKSFSKIFTGFAVLIALLITGCATNSGKAFVRDNNITIERVNSERAFIKRVDIINTSMGVLIYGVVMRNERLSTDISGHVDIEIIAPDGQLLLKSCVNHKRIIYKTRKAKFELKTSIVPGSGSIVRVSHHDDQCSI